MCFNSTTSIVAFAISAICSAYLFYNGKVNNNKSDLFFSIVVFLIGCMQLVEYFLWENQTCNNVNRLFSLFIVVVLTLQTVVWCVSYYYLHPNNRYFLTTMRQCLIFLFIFVFIYILFIIYTVLR